jgi:hypothetical protein
VEVVPTEFHWEAAYVAPVMPMARGWERQLDVANNPLFYQAGQLTAQSYRTWLDNNGVAWVALSDAPLDGAGVAESKLVLSGTVPGLDEVWHSAHWKLYSVAGGNAIVQGPAWLVSETGDGLVLQSTGAGDVLIRVHYSPDWTLASGEGCLAEAAGSWIGVSVPGPEQFSLGLSLFGADSEDCPMVQAAAAS